MDSGIKRGARSLLVMTLLAALLGASGCSLAQSGGNSAPSTGNSDKYASVSELGYGAAPGAPTPLSASPEIAGAPRSDVAAQAALPDRLIISNGSMTIEVKNVDQSVAAVRALAAASGAQIVGLTVQAGDGPPSGPQPLADGSGAQVGGPGTAQITLRIPADKLTTVENAAAKLGRVLTQSASESDVTQQHVDMAARLKNLQAEEAQFRAFLTKTTKVSEMLEVERELSRVRGEIESMQAQLAYLEQQTAMATLTLSLASPGSLVEPAGGTWGFSVAVRNGIQAAAALVAVLITAAIALSPIALVVALIVWLVLARKRRKRARAQLADDNDAQLVEVQTPPAE